ncbi:phage tail protein [Avibacterium paragallinarum]
MANLLTPEFEQYIAQQTVNNGTVIFDEFIFANIPALNEHNLTDYLTLSAVNDHIVHRQAVSKAGVVNQNSVVYSVTIGTEVGDWNYNFIGLINKSKKLLACAIQSEPIKKIKNKAGVQGNSITRSVLLEFSNAKTLTNINVNAQTWQIDFTLRLSGLDEKIRLTNRDMYGRAVFFDDGFLVSRKTGNIYNINAGTAYIEGVRANLPQHTEINATNLPCSIYVDVVHHCTVTGAYETEIQFLTRNKTDYLDQAAHQHYVQIIADIDSQGQITDRRLLDGRFIPNSKKSSATDSESEDTVATSKAVNQLNELKADKATTLAGYGITDFAQRALTASDNLNDITVKGLYRNTSYLNTTNNNYPENASGVLFVLSSAEQVYFSITGKIWKRFKDTNNWANGWARVDGNAIFEEGGMIKKTLVLNETLVMKRLFAGNQAREWANYHSQQGHTFYLSEDRSKKGMSLTQEGLEVVGTLKGEDFNLGNGHSLKTLFTQIGSFSLIADLGEMNINELKFPCIAGQPRNDNARCDRGYPVEARAGSLSVMPSAYGYKQVYNTYDYGLIFTRNQTANGEWGEWRRCDSRIKDVQILTGVVQHGSTLPIPSGFSENECKFFISLNFDDPSLSGWDIQEVGAGKHYYQKCYLTGREVTAQVWHGSGRGMDVGKWIDGKANYLVIGIKEG